MAGVESNEIDGDVLSVLLHPSIVAVMDIFRAPDRIRLSDELAFVQEAELKLGRYTTRALAREIVSEALLLSFAVAGERSLPMRFHPIGARRLSDDERALMGLISAAILLDGVPVSQEATSELGVPPDALASSAAHHLAVKIAAAGLAWPVHHGPRTISKSSTVAWPVASPDDAAFKFKK